MIALDWAIVVFTLLMAFWGYRQGLVVGAMTLGAFALGAIAGGRIGPALLTDGSESPYAPLTALAGALLLGGTVALLVEGAALALRRRLVRGTPAAVLDGSGGAVLIAALALSIAWMLGAVALNAPNRKDLREAVQRSAILQELNGVMPPSGSVIKALHRIDPGLEIRAPRAQVAAPDPGLVSDPQVAAAGDSVVRVLGTACGLGVEGSGWVAGGDLVVTNAHVIAGEQDTTVTEPGSDTRRDAIPVYLDTANDIAVLRVIGLEGDALPLRPDPPSGTAGVLQGYPENGPFTATPVRIGPTASTVSRDSYGNGPVRRPLTSMRGVVRSGNSGGPVVDADGRVLTTVFASTTGDRANGAGGFGVPNEVVAGAIAGAGDEVSTGPCTR